MRDVGTRLWTAVSRAYFADKRSLTARESLDIAKHWGYKPVRGYNGTWVVRRVYGHRSRSRAGFKFRVLLKRLLVSREPGSYTLQDSAFRKAVTKSRVLDAIRDIAAKGTRWERLTVTPTEGGYLINPPGGDKSIKSLGVIGLRHEAIEYAETILAAAGGGRLIVQGAKGRIEKNLGVAAG